MPCGECGHDTPLFVTEERQVLPGREEGDSGYWLIVATSATPPRMVRPLPISEGMAARLSEIDRGVARSSDDGGLVIDIASDRAPLETIRFVNIPSPLADDLLTDSDPDFNIVEVVDWRLPPHLPAGVGLVVQLINT